MRRLIALTALALLAGCDRKPADQAAAPPAAPAGGPASQDTEPGALMGTLCYMSPEQARGDWGQVGPATDVYALGATLYELLTLWPPFRESDRVRLIEQVLHEEPTPPHKLDRRIPRDLETVCLTCLRKEPGRRYASAADLADDLWRFLAGEPVRARPVGRLERAVKWCRRRPAAARLHRVRRYRSGSAFPAPAA